MGTKNTRSLLASALFGKVRTAVLALLFGHTDREFYLREIVRATGVGQGAVQRELAQLVRVGLLTRERRGNLVMYRANRESPVFRDLIALVAKTAGVADVLREHLSGLAEKIDVAFIYGSIASGTEAPASDIDLFVIGDVDAPAVYERLWAARQQLGREVDGRVFPAEEYRARLRDGDHFFTALASEPKLFIIGSEYELRELGEPGSDRGARAA